MGAHLLGKGRFADPQKHDTKEGIHPSRCDRVHFVADCIDEVLHVELRERLFVGDLVVGLSEEREVPILHTANSLSIVCLSKYKSCENNSLGVVLHLQVPWLLIRIQQVLL